MPALNQHDPTSITVAEIQSLTSPDVLALSRLRREGEPGHGETSSDLLDSLRRLVSGGGRAWVVRRGQSLAGYASVMPVPGLPGLYELDGFIAPAQRRQGVASAFLQTIIERLAGSDVSQLSYPVSSTETPAARFLLKNGFCAEHEEQLLVLDELSALPAVDPGPGLSLSTLACSQAIAHFRRLYEASFAGLAWFQPYEDDQEVARELADAGDLLFLADGDQPIGFLWLRWPDVQLAEIEPVGLLPAYRGRGLGRWLVVAGLRQAAQQGAGRVQTGLWRTNAVAWKLYRQLGFRPAGTTIYLAYDLT
jgi:mycothiol synthase